MPGQGQAIEVNKWKGLRRRFPASTYYGILPFALGIGAKYRVLRIARPACGNAHRIGPRMSTNLLFQRLNSEVFIFNDSFVQLYDFVNRIELIVDNGVV